MSKTKSAVMNSRLDNPHLLACRFRNGDGGYCPHPQAPAGTAGPRAGAGAAAGHSGAGAAGVAGNPRHRTRPRPQRPLACANSLARLEGHHSSDLSGDPGGPPAGARRQRRLLLAGGAVPGPRRRRVVLCALRRRRHHRQASVARRRHRSGRRARHAARRDHPHRRQKRRQADIRLPARAGHRAVERQCRNEGDLRRAQHHL